MRAKRFEEAHDIVFARRKFTNQCSGYIVSLHTGCQNAYRDRVLRLRDASAMLKKLFQQKDVMFLDDFAQDEDSRKLLEQIKDSSMAWKTRQNSYRSVHLYGRFTSLKIESCVQCKKIECGFTHSQRMCWKQKEKQCFVGFFAYQRIGACLASAVHLL